MDRLEAVARMGCVICGQPAQVHHIRSHTGMGIRPDDSQTIPLCLDHHTGRDGIHQIGRWAWEARFGTQADHLARVNLLLDFLEEDT